MRTRTRLAVAVAAATAVVVAPVIAVNAIASVPSTPPGWSLVFSDDFTGAANTGVNSSNWLYDLGTSYPGGAGNWGTGEVETMTNSTQNVYQDGAGNLAIRPVRDSSGHWTSGRIETQRTDFQPPAGGVLRVESRLQMPNVTGAAAQGYWPAFWMLGAPFRGVYTNWPSVGEADIMENVNGANTVWGTLHCGVSPGGPCNETSGIGSSRACPGASCQSAFHTYRFEWDRSVSPNQMRWYVDGTQYHTVNANQVDATTWNNATNHGYFVILNVAMGGGWPGNPTAQTASGVPMLVDYVAVWTSTGTPPPTTTTSAPPPGSRDAYATIQAESFNAQSGVVAETTTDTGGGQDIGYLANGDWARYDGVNFGSGSAGTFSARVASGAAAGVSGSVEVRLDNVNNAPVGSFTISNTGGWQSWRTVAASITPVTGTHTVFLRFASGQSADFVNVNWFTFSAGGTPPPTTTSSPPPGGRDAYGTIQAESFNAQSGVLTEATTDTGGGQNIANLANGDWVRYDGVNFGSTAARGFSTRAASGAAGGVSGLVEVRLDDVNSAPIGSFAIANTGGWQSWQTVPANITPVTGTHTVYLRFTSGQPADFVNVNWFVFTH
jgi:hypothetical protein